MLEEIVNVIEHPASIVTGLVHAFNLNYEKDILEFSYRSNSSFDKAEMAVCSAIQSTIVAIIGHLYLGYDRIRSCFNSKK